MSLIKHNCVTVACDKCGDELENGDGVTLHFDEKTEDPRWDMGLDDWNVWDDADGVTHHMHDDCTPMCACGDPFHAHDGGSEPCEEEDGCQRFTLPVEAAP